MKKSRSFWLAAGLVLIFLPVLAQEDFLKIDGQVYPRSVLQGEEGMLKIRFTTRSDVRISSYPEFMIRLEGNQNVSFSKDFFMGSELNFPTSQENNDVFLDLQKEVEIPFKVNEQAYTGNQIISGEIVYTVFFQDNWHIKTFQKFSVGFSVRRNYRLKHR